MKESKLHWDDQWRRNDIWLRYKENIHGDCGIWNGPWNIVGIL